MPAIPTLQYGCLVVYVGMPNVARLHISNRDVEAIAVWRPNVG